MQETRLSQLFDAYLRGTCSPKEKEELFLLSLETEKKTELDRLLHDYIESEEERVEMGAEQTEALYDQILRQAGKTGRVAGAGALVHFLRRPWVRYAAAVLIILAGIGSYFLLNNTSPPVVSVKQPSGNTILPGGNKAVLTLGSGRKIILDSAHNGSLTVQGNVLVSKTDSGQLAYRSTGNAAGSVTMYNTLSTPRGGQYQLILPDGTRVWLNAASSITYPTAFIGSDRRVTITGEAYFEVKKRASSPFFVKTGNLEIAVLGTSFDINAYTDEPAVNTTLLEGLVRVSQGSDKAGAVIIRPGQQARVNNGHIGVTDQVDTGQVMAWKNGYFSFDEASLESIMRQIGRWYDVEIVYEGDVKDERFAGTVPRSSNVSELLNELSLTKTVQFIIEEKKIIVRSYRP